MSLTNVVEQPLIKLSELQFKVYNTVKQLQPTTVNDLRNNLKEVKKSSLAAALRALKEKSLIVYENLHYNVTDKISFVLKHKKPAEDYVIHASNVQDQLEWNRQILQQKALREARMRINI